jgi:hypothetical protein
LQDIRTLAGTVDQVATPYRAYMRLSCLEMEKFRRGKERESAMHRVNNIDARFAEIEAEKASLLQVLGERGAGRRARRSAEEDKPASARCDKGFKIRY